MMVQVGVMRGARRELRETVPTPRARDLLLLVLDCSLGQYARESSLVGDLQIAGAAHRLLLLGSARGTGFVEVCHCLRSSGRPTAITEQVDRHLQEAGGASIERRWPTTSGEATNCFDLDELLRLGYFGPGVPKISRFELV